MAKLGSYGGWAVVTGASAGIGDAFARALAADGVSVVLTARREDRLTSLANALEARPRVQTRVVPLDPRQEDGHHDPSHWGREVGPDLPLGNGDDRPHSSASLSVAVNRMKISSSDITTLFISLNPHPPFTIVAASASRTSSPA